MKGAGSLDPAPGKQAPHERSEEERSEPRPVERAGGFQAVLAVTVSSWSEPGAFKRCLRWLYRVGAFRGFSK